MTKCENGFVTVNAEWPKGTEPAVEVCGECDGEGCDEDVVASEKEAEFIAAANPSRVKAMAELLIKVAEVEPLWNSDLGDVYCLYCDGWRTETYTHAPFPHEPGCLYLEIKKFVGGEGNDDSNSNS